MGFSGPGVAAKARRVVNETILAVVFVVVWVVGKVEIVKRWKGKVESLWC